MLDHCAKEQGSLRKHKQSLHEGVKYNCDQCSYQATEHCSLRKHKLSIHEGAKYNCDPCSYQAK